MTHPLRRAVLIVLAVALSACASSRSLDESFADIGADAQLKSVLFADRSHDYSDVDITMFEGRLMLTGTVWTQESHDKLLANANKASGVEEIIDEVLIADKTSFGQGFEDARIDQTLRARLIGDKNVTSGRYKIAVSKAVVYLIGAARTEAELEQAIDHARAVAGVEKVVSHVVLREAGDAQTLR